MTWIMARGGGHGPNCIFHPSAQGRVPALVSAAGPSGARRPPARLAGAAGFIKSLSGNELELEPVMPLSVSESGYYSGWSEMNDLEPEIIHDLLTT